MGCHDNLIASCLTCILKKCRYDYPMDDKTWLLELPVDVRAGLVCGAQPIWFCDFVKLMKYHVHPWDIHLYLNIPITEVYRAMWDSGIHNYYGINTWNDFKVKLIRDLFDTYDLSASTIANILHITRASIYKYCYYYNIHQFSYNNRVRGDFYIATVEYLISDFDPITFGTSKYIPGISNVSVRIGDKKKIIQNSSLQLISKRYPILGILLKIPRSIWRAFPKISYYALTHDVKSTSLKFGITEASIRTLSGLFDSEYFAASIDAWNLFLLDYKKKREGIPNKFR